MKKKSTSFSFASDDEASSEVATQISKSRAGSPRQSTLDMIRRFARAYHFDNSSSFPAAIILN